MWYSQLPMAEPVPQSVSFISFRHSGQALPLQIGSEAKPFTVLQCLPFGGSKCLADKDTHEGPLTT